MACRNDNCHYRTFNLAKVAKSRWISEGLRSCCDGQKVDSVELQEVEALITREYLDKPFTFHGDGYFIMTRAAQDSVTSGGVRRWLSTSRPCLRRYPRPRRFHLSFWTALTRPR